MESGTAEVVYSQTEQIGLPNWSHIQLLVSAKATVKLTDEDAAYNHLHAVVHSFVMATSDRIARSLNLMGMGVPDALPEIPAGMLHDNPVAIMSGPVECVFSMNEQISLPSNEKGQNNSIRLMASHKSVWGAASIDEGLAYSGDRVRAQMGQKRTMVKSAPRAWISPT